MKKTEFITNTLTLNEVLKVLQAEEKLSQMECLSFKRMKRENGKYVDNL